MQTEEQRLTKILTDHPKVYEMLEAKLPAHAYLAPPSAVEKAPTPPPLPAAGPVRTKSTPTTSWVDKAVAVDIGKLDAE